jgi:hypothetical protein
MLAATGLWWLAPDTHDSQLAFAKLANIVCKGLIK